MPASKLPLIVDYAPQRVFAWRDGQAIRSDRALLDIQTLTQSLDAGTPCINLCEDRYYFTLAFMAVAAVDGFCLLPQSRASGVLQTLHESHPHARTIDDEQVAACLAAGSVERPWSTPPQLSAFAKVALVFTSGSTGQPGQHEKHWDDLVQRSVMFQRRFFPDGDVPHTVATVPPQHMYGLETSVFPAMHIGFPADACRPFMPWAVAEALAQLPAPRLLITTPVHLRACLDSNVAMPAIERVISASAPLDAELARAAETAWQTQVHEIYGSTETGSVASRRTTATDIWTLYEGITVTNVDGTWLQAPLWSQAMLLGDTLDVLGDGRFRLLGRTADMLKLAGKRISLNEITRLLKGIEGVEDAVAFKQTDDGSRPAALVVAPDLPEHEITTRLARQLDPVFVPRPLLRVDALPRNELGKLPRGALLAALQGARPQSV